MRSQPDYNDNTLAIAYYRYSSASQNEASIDQQRELVHRWAASQKLTIFREYDDPARTGTNTNRPGFQRMMSEISEIKPAYLVMWKNDRLGRNVMDVLAAKQMIRAAGCRIHYIEGIDPNDDPDTFLMQLLMDGMAAHYSQNLSRNIRRGVNYNAERALSNGRRIFGFMTGKDKRYELDPRTAPMVKRMFDDYARGKSMQRIAEELNAAGVRTVNGRLFTSKSLNKLLKNRAYIGEYCYAGHVIPGGMPQIVDDVTFDEVQKMFAMNKHRGAKTKAELAAMSSEAPDYWLTGRLFCERCGAPLEGVSGTSKTGRKYRYYYCLNQRRKQCTAKPVRKDLIEDRVTLIVESFLENTEMLASLAVDMADHYRRTHSRAREILNGLESRRNDVESKLANFVNAIAMGIMNQSTAAAMASLEGQKQELDAAIQAEHVKTTLFENEASIGAFYKRFARETMDGKETRDLLFEYFIDKIFVKNKTMTIASWFFDGGQAITLDDLPEAKQTGEVLNIEFDTSPSGGAAGGRNLRRVEGQCARVAAGRCRSGLERPAGQHAPAVGREEERQGMGERRRAEEDHHRADGVLLHSRRSAQSRRGRGRAPGVQRRARPHPGIQRLILRDELPYDQLARQGRRQTRHGRPADRPGHGMEPQPACRPGRAGPREQLGRGLGRLGGQAGRRARPVPADQARVLLRVERIREGEV
jgi:DNA invertase Pin-like site-specific DNA recombinase